ncbi:hypothetical protein Emed_001926 [Eimeria media]
MEVHAVEVQGYRNPQTLAGGRETARQEKTKPRRRRRSLEAAVAAAAATAAAAAATAAERVQWVSYSSVR